ncbi:MAG: gamma-glutamylcyclotransferase family protein [Sphingomonadaceae bacterium]|nr:gamma-glutamylcyclotransferase [Sphingomonadaceae bacterium]
MKLFFYGVLMGEVAPPPVRSLLAGIGPGQPATVRGTIYAVTGPGGAYPVLLPGDDLVHGRMHDAGNVDLAALDRFESVDPVDPLAGEYRREEITAVDGEGESHVVQAYLWNGELDQQNELIPDGDFAVWLMQSGYLPFGQ